MEGSGSPFYTSGYESMSMSSCSATPDQSPMTPFAMVPGFMPYFTFSSYVAAQQMTQMCPVVFYGSASPAGKLQLPPESMDQQPVFVNARQYHRILKRRMTRRSHQAHTRTRRSTSYVHESRHRHACTRERGPSGMFLPKDGTTPRDKKEKTIDKYSASYVLYQEQTTDGDDKMLT